jgi:phosphatidylglycerol lysyltransferase
MTAGEGAARTRRVLVWPAGLVTLGSGILNLLLVMHPHLPPRGSWFEDVFPLEFFRLSRFLTLLIGFALVITSFALLHRKRRAWWTATLLAGAVIPFHLAQGLDWRGAVFAAFLLVLLVVARPAFVVRSEVPDLRRAVLGILGAAALAIAYGTAGFWLLERHHFAANFPIRAALRQALLHLAFVGDPSLQPQTGFARWFLDSLDVTTVAAIVYAGFMLYRPVVHRFRELPEERRRAAAIVAKHGRSALDFFKYWPDKAFFFAPGGEAFVAYRVGGRHAIVLGDPVGPEASVEPIVGAFREFCVQNDWGLAFHQAGPDFLPVYERLGFHRLKIGDDAIVDLASFGLEGGKRKGMRNTIANLERQGVTFTRHEPPLAADLVHELRNVSDEWLRLPGRRERQFTLGLFHDAYVRETPVVVVRGGHGEVLAFANLIPSFAPGEATIDLMRRRADVPNGTMDYLFIKLLLQLKESGVARLNLGMAPMAGFSAQEQSTAEERALHAFFQRLKFLFSFAGLRAYKAKFATTWEPRYLIHQGILELPAVALAIARVSEMRGREPDWDLIPPEEPSTVVVDEPADVDP